MAYVEQRAQIDTTFPISVFDVGLSGSYGRVGLFKSPGRQEQQTAERALKQVKLWELRDRQIGELSGGQLQRVFIARTIVQAADLIILDEPFVGIDMKSEAEIMMVLRQWREIGKTVIVVHHDLNKVTDYFDHILVMNHGILAQGEVQQVYQYDIIKQAFSADLGQALFAGGA